MRVDSIPAREHRPEYYGSVYEGYRALRLLGEDGVARGELVWRLATGDAVEITEMGIYDPADRRKGWGSRLMEAGIENMRAFFRERQLRFRRIYLFCDSVNDAGRRFYEAQGFTAQARLTDFYHYCDAMLYVRDVEDRPPSKET